MKTNKFVLSATLLAAIAVGCGDSDSGAAGSGGTGGTGGTAGSGGTGGGFIPDRVCDNETVPDFQCPTGEACLMTACVVEGNVEVEPGSEIVLQRTNVNGRLTGSATPAPMDGEASIQLIESSVRQGIDVPFSTGIRFESADIDDDVTLEDVSGALVVQNCNIDGNIQTKNATSLRAEDNVVNGNIQLQDMSLGDASSIVRRNRVDGDIQIQNSSSTEFFIENNVSDGNLQAQDNTGRLTILTNDCDNLQVEDNNATGPHTISGNTVRGNLQCSGNTPAPTGGNNNVSGDREGQCSGL